MIILGLALLVIGYFAKISVLETIGLVVALLGAALFFLGRTGHAVGGRHHYW